MKYKLIVANWKMQKTHNQSLDWCRAHEHELHDLGQYTHVKLVLCPSFTTLGAIKSLLPIQNIFLGAQDCAFKELGPYTGDVSVLSLKELGCSYCIIGHSERRLYQHESPQSVAQKAELLVTHSIEPLICVGETAQEHIDHRALPVILEQLVPVLQKIKHKANHVYIVYEPIWTIGTGKTPEPTYLEELFKHLIATVHEQYPTLKPFILYGGSVTQQTVPDLLQVSTIDGFLLGRASLDFQTLKNIVRLVEEKQITQGV